MKINLNSRQISLDIRVWVCHTLCMETTTPNAEQFTLNFNQPAEEVKTVWLSCADTARHLRAALKAAFPGQKFSVRSHCYAGGASVNVSYTGGPAEDVVEEVAGGFKGATFDGMTDSMNYHTSMLDGVPVRYGADFVFVRRNEAA